MFFSDFRITRRINVKRINTGCTVLLRAFNTDNAHKFETKRQLDVVLLASKSIQNVPLNLRYIADPVYVDQHGRLMIAALGPL